MGVCVCVVCKRSGEEMSLLATQVGRQVERTLDRYVGQRCPLANRPTTSCLPSTAQILHFSNS